MITFFQGYFKSSHLCFKKRGNIGCGAYAVRWKDLKGAFEMGKLTDRFEKKRFEEKKIEKKMEKRNIEKKKIRKKRLAGMGIAVVIIACGGIWSLFSYYKKDNGDEDRNMPQMEWMDKNVVAASGLTATGVTEEEYELEFLETALYVEESYLSIGDTVEEGTPVFKVSDATLKKAREELEKAFIEAELAYRWGVIDYEVQRLEADSTYRQAKINEEYAWAEYDSSLETAKQEVEELEKQVEEAQELYEEYTASVESDYYYDYYKVGELEEAYYENFTFLMKLYEKWDIDSLRDRYPNEGNHSEGNAIGANGVGSATGLGDISMGNKEEVPIVMNASMSDMVENKYVFNSMSAEGEVTEEKVSERGNKEDGTGGNDNQGSDTENNENDGRDSQGEDIDEGKGDANNENEMHGGEAGSRKPEGGVPETGGMAAGVSFYSEESGKLSVYEMMEELVEKNGQAYETALENYEKDKRRAEASLDAAASELAELWAKLTEAQLEYEKQIIASKAEYEATIEESENARSSYDTTMKKLEEDLEALKDEKEECAEKLELFESTIGTGYFYTHNAGTVMMNMVRAESYLSTEGMWLAYSNAEIVTVAALVGQEDIAKIQVGDSAYVMINGYADYGGKVISINPVSSSDSRSSVTYTVTVELEGDMAGLESNLTAYVYLEMEEELLEQMKSGGNGQKPEENAQSPSWNQREERKHGRREQVQEETEE